MSEDKIKKIEKEIEELKYKTKQKELELSYLKKEQNSDSAENIISIPFFNNMTKENLLIPASIVIAGIIIAISLFLAKSPATNKKIEKTNSPQNTVTISADDDPYLGPQKAKVTIIEFSDFQCPFCRRLWQDTIQKIKDQYINANKSVKLVYRDFPLNFHPMAQTYAEAAECADEQGKFWEMHDKIFEEQGKLGTGTITSITKDDVKNWAKELRLNTKKFNECLDSEKYKSEVQKDLLDGQKAGVKGTPTLFINGREVRGAQPFEVFKAIIDEELNK